MKNFVETDVQPHGAIAGAGSLDAFNTDLISAPLWYHQRGLSQTSSGYGAKLTTSRKILFNGKQYRIYCSCYGNSGSAWFKAKGRQIFVNSF